MTTEFYIKKGPVIRDLFLSGLGIIVAIMLLWHEFGNDSSFIIVGYVVLIIVNIKIFLNAVKNYSLYRKNIPFIIINDTQIENRWTDEHSIIPFKYIESFELTSSVLNIIYKIRSKENRFKDVRYKPWYKKDIFPLFHPNHGQSATWNMPKLTVGIKELELSLNHYLEVFNTKNKKAEV